jgi:predicted ribosome quality control (RQC) complex YloA/Tae2 family protein
MHNNYFFLNQLSSSLHKKLVGFTLVSCFSQNKEELIIEFNNSAESFFIKASLQPSLCCLSFPNNFHRAKKNSIDLFIELTLKKVVGVTQYENERSFSLKLEGDYHLLFKMHGSQSNVVLVHQQKAVAIFRNQFQTDWEIELSKLNRTIDWSEEKFTQSIQDLPKTYFTLGKEFWNYLSMQNFESLAVDEKWKLFSDALTLLNHPTFYANKTKGKVLFSLLPSTTSSTELSNNPIEAITEFYYQSTVTNAQQSEKTIALRHWHEQLKSKDSYITKNQQKLHQLVNDQHYQLWADLLMANMHLVKQGTEKVILESFYDQQPVEIKLKRELNAQRNAEIFYRKAKNQQIEINKLKESIAQKEKEVESINKTIQEIESNQVSRSKLQINPSSLNLKRELSLPYREVEFKGYKIWVGKNAESNDELTLKYSFKEDLWLHAKDVAGSHVLLKHQANKNFPKDVIERAAQLAAHYSKRKNESLCPVTVTPKKFVRKRKGDPAGMVVVEKEDVVLVEPRG